MRVRKANVSDVTFIVDSQLAMALETEGIRLNRVVVEKGVAAVFDNNSRGIYYLAEENGTVIGSLLTTYEWSDWRNGTVLWIQSVYIQPQHRRKGVYRRLYQFIQDIVVSDPELFGIRLYADVSNKTAHQAYLNLGMDDSHYKTFEWMKP